MPLASVLSQSISHGRPIRQFLRVSHRRLSTQSPPPTPHHSLATFIAHARRTNLSPTSTTYVGTHYEYVCQAALTSLGFSLVRSGGRADAGVDLYGTWALPELPQPLRCIVQCKALAKKVGPNLIRELDGAFAGAPAGWRSSDAVAVLCATRPASRGVREAVRRSERGIVWVLLEDGRADDNTEASTAGRIRQVVWNERVAELGAAGVGIGAICAPHSTEGDREVRLMWKGQVWQPEVALNEADGAA